MKDKVGQNASSSEMKARGLERALDAKRMNVLRPYQVALRNLQSLDTRIKSRIAKLEAQGIDESAAKVLLTTAEADIAVVQNDLTSFTTSLGQVTSTTTRKMILANIKTLATKARNDVKTAHKALVQVIVSLKPGQHMGTSTKEHGNEHEGTSTDTTSTSTNN